MWEKLSENQITPIRQSLWKCMTHLFILTVTFLFQSRDTTFTQWSTLLHIFREKIHRQLSLSFIHNKHNLCAACCCNVTYNKAFNRRPCDKTRKCMYVSLVHHVSSYLSVCVTPGCTPPTHLHPVTSSPHSYVLLCSPLQIVPSPRAWCVSRANS